MTPDDARHGKATGYRLGCREACCRGAMAAAMALRRRRLYLERTDSLSVAPHRVRRRIQALVALGWSLSAISRASGYHRSHVSLMLKRRTNLSEPTSQRIFDVYAALCMTLPPERTKIEKIDASRARNMAQARGWVGPLAWDDIDNDAAPIGTRWASRPDEYDGRNIIDPVTVLRLLAGEKVPANYAERDEAMRRWKSDGRSERSLCELQGWKETRYGRTA